MTYASEADKYTGKYPVIPAKKGSKAPAIAGFTEYQDKLPTPEEIATRKNKLGSQNISCVMGGGLMMVDVDGGDAYVRLVEAVLDRPTCKRFGSKGMGFIVTGPDEVKTMRFKNCEEKQVIEIIAAGSHAILPPSIHFKTGKPYEWHSKPLYEFERDELAHIGWPEIKFLEYIISRPEHLELINGNPTHDAIRDIAWFGGARLVDEDTFIRAAMALVPEGYDGNLEEDAKLVYRSAQAKQTEEFVSGKGKKQAMGAADRLLSMVSNDPGIELFHDQMKVPCISFKRPEKGRVIYTLNSTAAKAELRRMYFNEMKRAIPSKGFTEAHDTLCAQALHEGQKCKIFLRVADEEA